MPSRVSPADDVDDGYDSDDDKEGEVSSDEEDSDTNETVMGRSFQGVNSRFARVAGRSAISR